MKKFVSACLMAGLLTCAAGAAQVGTIDNNYPGDTEAQAQMLYDLGLFKGTDKGFALEKSMTRAEASVMLTRLLGAEKTALAGNWKHPFTDVPQWADKYVGWLEWFDQGRFRDTVRLAAQCHLRPVLHFSDPGTFGCGQLSGYGFCR